MKSGRFESISQSKDRSRPTRELCSATPPFQKKKVAVSVEPFGDQESSYSPVFECVVINLMSVDFPKPALPWIQNVSVQALSHSTKSLLGSSKIHSNVF